MAHNTCLMSLISEAPHRTYGCIRRYEELIGASVTASVPKHHAYPATVMVELQKCAFTARSLATAQLRPKIG